MYCSQFHVDCWSHLRCRRALHQDKPRDVDIDHRQRHRCDCASRGRGERDKMEAERECREIVQGTQFQNWILSNGFNENNESLWKDSTWVLNPPTRIRSKPKIKSTLFVLSGGSLACNQGLRAADHRPCQGTNEPVSRWMGGVARKITGVLISTREKIRILPQLGIRQHLYWGYRSVPGKRENCLFSKIFCN